MYAFHLLLGLVSLCILPMVRWIFALFDLAVFFVGQNTLRKVILTMSFNVVEQTKGNLKLQT
jgi:type IV secretory pathway TrbD component